MTKPKRLSLTEYAAENPLRVGQPCWMCAIPEREECEAASAAGMSKTVIMRWLENECGYGDEATSNRVSRHLLNHVKKTAR